MLPPAFSSRLRYTASLKNVLTQVLQKACTLIFSFNFRLLKADISVSVNARELTSILLESKGFSDSGGDNLTLILMGAYPTVKSSQLTR